MASPTDILVSGGIVREREINGVVIATLATVDADPGDTFTYAITNDPSGAFTIVGDEIRVLDGTAIDYETADSMQVTVEVTDSQFNTFSKIVTISVLNLNEIDGDGNPNTIPGTVGDDVIDGLAGNDSITGDAGSDILYGGAGLDTLRGGFGDDYLDGGTENDQLYGDTGADTLIGGDGNDRLEARGAGSSLDGGEGNDQLYNFATSGTATLVGGGGNDTLRASTSNSAINETLSGGADDDRIEYVGLYSSDTVDAGTGNDTVLLYGYTNSGQVSTLTLGDGQDTIGFFASNPQLNVQHATVTDFATGAGGDRLDLTFILSNLTGYGGTNPFGSGFLQLVADGVDTLLQVDANGATGGSSWTTLFRFQNTAPGDFTADNFTPAWPTDGSAPAGQNIVGTPGNDQGLTQIVGTLGDDTIDGLGGNDSITGDAGSDTIYGGAGLDTLRGGFGDDYLDGGTENDQLYGDTGTDTLIGGDGNDRLEARGAGSSLDGGEGNDQLYNFATSGTATLVGGGGNDTLRASTSNSAINETLSGGADDDRIEYVGFYSSDTVDAGTGNDTVLLYSFTNSGQVSTLTLGDGQDTIGFFASNPQLNVQHATVTDFATGAGGDRLDITFILSNLTGYGGTNPFGSGFLQLVADGVDTLLQVDANGATGGSTWTTLFRFQNTDPGDFTADNFTPAWPTDGSAPAGQNIVGTPGNDQGLTQIVGTLGDDTIDGLGGNDSITGDAGSDTIYGGAGLDTLRGGFGDDYLDGGTENDQLYGDTGTDTLIGGDGNDRLEARGAGSSLDGGEGNDQLYNFATSGTATLVGGGGNDTLRASTSNSAINETLSGGADDDRIEYVGFYSSDTVDAGTGNDTVLLYSFTNSGQVSTLTLGDGQDTIGFFASNPQLNVQHATVTDFATGAGGDRLDITFILSNLTGYGGTNPFGSGFLQLVADGVDTLLQVDANGATGGSTWTTLFRFQNTDPGDFTADNFTPAWPTDGSAPAGQNIVGTPGNDQGLTQIVGTLGDDTIDGLGGNDSITGDAGSDTIYGGAGLDTLRGNDGNDTLTGGPGVDEQHGEAGDDVFIVTAADLAPGEIIDGGADIDTLRIEGGGTVDLTTGITLTSIEQIELAGPGNTTALVTAAQAALITSAAGANDIVQIASGSPNEALVKQLIDAGVERVEWSIPGFASAVEAVPDGLGGFIISYDDGDDLKPWDTIDAQYDSFGRKVSQTNDYDFPGPEGGITSNYTFDPATGFATTIVHTDGHLTRTFSTITTTLENGVVTEVDTVNDNDTLVEQFFTAGVITLERTTDTSSANAGKPWLYQDREYDGGVTQIFRTFWDAGVNGGGQHVVGTAGSQVIEGVALGGGVSTTNDALIGGAGSDTFRFVDGFGHDTIYDFADGADLLDLSSYAAGIETLAELQNAASITQVAFGAGFNTVIDFNASDDQITIRNFLIAQLGDGDFAV